MQCDICKACRLKAGLLERYDQYNTRCIADFFDNRKLDILSLIIPTLIQLNSASKRECICLGSPVCLSVCPSFCL